MVKTIQITWYKSISFWACASDSDDSTEVSSIFCVTDVRHFLNFFSSCSKNLIASKSKFLVRLLLVYGNGRWGDVSVASSSPSESEDWGEWKFNLSFSDWLKLDSCEVTSVMRCWGILLEARLNIMFKILKLYITTLAYEDTASLLDSQFSSNSSKSSIAFLMLEVISRIHAYTKSSVKLNSLSMQPIRFLLILYHSLAR